MVIKVTDLRIKFTGKLGLGVWNTIYIEVRNKFVIL